MESIHVAIDSLLSETHTNTNWRNSSSLAAFGISIFKGSGTFFLVEIWKSVLKKRSNTAVSHCTYLRFTCFWPCGRVWLV